MAKTKKSGYSGWSLKKKIIVYLIVGGIIYGLFYYFVMMPKGDYSFQSTTELNLQKGY